MVLFFVPIFVIAREDKRQKATGRSALCQWLFFHTFEVILLTIASLAAVWL